MSKLNLVRGLPQLRFEKVLVCVSCRHASSHPLLTEVMTERPCELPHVDLVGPAHVRSAGGKWYVLVVVDDYSRYACVFFLEEKGETFGFVWDLVLRLRNERHGDTIRVIHSDNGSEFKNSRFETFCHDLGLEHQFSCPYTPPQNGVVERKNRTLCEMARTILNEHRTPRRLWAEAVNTACYVSNRIYLRVHKKKTYYELMHGRTPKVSHFHVFGCKCFILKKGRKLDKFEARPVDGIFFGYAPYSRAYRVLNLKTNQIMETCEVTLSKTQPCSHLCIDLNKASDRPTVSPLRPSDHPMLLSPHLLLCNSSDATRKWTVGSSDGTLVFTQCTNSSDDCTDACYLGTVGSSDGVLSFSFLSCFWHLKNRLSSQFDMWYFGILDKDMLNNLVSRIDHVVMNHQNQTRNNGIWGHVRYSY
jgi:hypothetical protein